MRIKTNSSIYRQIIFLNTENFVQIAKSKLRITLVYSLMM